MAAARAFEPAAHRARSGGAGHLCAGHSGRRLSAFRVSSCGRAILAALCFAASFAGVGTLKVTIYGLRADFLHLPLIVVLPRVLRPDDVRRMGSRSWLVAAPHGAAGRPAVPGRAGLALECRSGRRSRRTAFCRAGQGAGLGHFFLCHGAGHLPRLVRRFSSPRSAGPARLSALADYSALPALVFTLAVSGSRTAVISVGIVCAMVFYMALLRPAAVSGRRCGRSCSRWQRSRPWRGSRRSSTKASPCIAIDSKAAAD